MHQTLGGEGEREEDGDEEGEGRKGGREGGWGRQERRVGMVMITSRLA